MTNEQAGGSKTGKEPAKVPLEITDKVRILCLHGYRQNGDAFKGKIGSLRKQLSKYAEFVFLTAPHKAAPIEPGSEVPDEQRSWWANKDDGTFRGTNRDGPAFGFQESLRSIEQAWKEQGPFQGLMGFSQGACFVGIICGLSKKKLTSIRPEFVIIAAGFESGSLVHKSIYEETITLPSLHVYGQTDDIIAKELSQQLSSHYRNAEVVVHPGGHYFPATAQQKQTYINFVQDRLQEYLEHLELQNAANAAFVEQPDTGDEQGTSNSEREEA